MNYESNINKRYGNEKYSGDDSGYIYSLRNTSGYFQKMLIEKCFIDLINQHDIRLCKCEKILDLGCGNGYWLRRMAEISGEAGNLYGLDLTETRIQQAQKINNSINYVIGDICNPPFNNNDFGFITAFVSFMFLLKEIDLIAAFNNVTRLLKKDGYFIFYDKIGTNIEGQDTRGFQIDEVKKYAIDNGLKFIGAKTLFKNIFKSNTAYLGHKYSFKQLLFLESFPFHSNSYMMLLFKKN